VPLSEDVILSLVWKNKAVHLNCGKSLVSPIGLQFPLCDREKTIEFLKDTISSHLKESSGDRKQHPLPVLAATPDIGKVVNNFM